MELVLFDGKSFMEFGVLSCDNIRGWRDRAGERNRKVVFGTVYPHPSVFSKAMPKRKCGLFLFFFSHSPTAGLCHRGTLQLR